MRSSWRPLAIVAGIMALLALLIWVLGRAPAEAPAPMEARTPVTATTTRAAIRPAIKAPPAKPRSATRAAMSGPADPLRTLLTAEDTSSAMVLELNALLHSPLADALLPCFDLQPGGGRLKDLEALLGEGGIERFDRLAVGEDLIMLTGQIPETVRDALDGAAYGKGGRLLGEHVAMWGDGVLLAGDDTAALKKAIDRLEGRQPAGTPLFSDDDTASDLYAVLGGELMQSMIEGAPALAQPALGGVSALRLRARAGDVLQPELTLEGNGLETIQTFVSGWLAARAKQPQQGPPDRGVAELARDTRLTLDQGRLTAAVDVPQELVARRLRSCSIGLDRAALPAPYRAVARPDAPGWDIPMLPGFVPASANEKALLADWPGYGKLLELAQQVGSTDERYIDPLTLDTVTFTRSLGEPEGCGRLIAAHEKWIETPRFPNEVVTKTRIGGRTWYRLVEELEHVVMIDFLTCEPGRYWKLTAGITGQVPTELAAARLETYLAQAKLE